MKSTVVEGLEITGPMNPRYAEILSPEACRFLAGLFREFGPRREQLLAKRVERQREIDAGRLPDFLPETAHIRGGNWRHGDDDGAFTIHLSPVPSHFADDLGFRCAAPAR